MTDTDGRRYFVGVWRNDTETATVYGIQYTVYITDSSGHGTHFSQRANRKVEIQFAKHPMYEEVYEPEVTKMRMLGQWQLVDLRGSTG